MRENQGEVLPEPFSKQMCATQRRAERQNANGENALLFSFSKPVLIRDKDVFRNFFFKKIAITHACKISSVVFLHERHMNMYMFQQWLEERREEFPACQVPDRWEAPRDPGGYHQHPGAPSEEDGSRRPNIATSEEERLKIAARLLKRETLIIMACTLTTRRSGPQSRGTCLESAEPKLLPSH